MKQATQFIEAITDYYGTPKGHLVHINPNYIIQMVFMGECEDCYGNKFKDHYVITVDFGNKTEELHIELEVGKKLLSDGGIKI